MKVVVTYDRKDGTPEGHVEFDIAAHEWDDNELANLNGVWNVNTRELLNIVEVRVG